MYVRRLARRQRQRAVDKQDDAMRTGDDAPFLSYDERFEHPARTWASSSHRKFTHAAVGIAMAAATFRFMQATAKTAMRRVLGIRGGQGETLVLPTAVAGGDEGFVPRRLRRPLHRPLLPASSLFAPLPPSAVSQPRPQHLSHRLLALPSYPRPRGLHCCHRHRLHGE